MDDDQQQETQDPKLAELIFRVKGKPFWYWVPRTHEERRKYSKGNCCFNDVIGRPVKNGKSYPLFEYQNILYRALMQDNYLNARPCNIPAPDTMKEKFERTKILDKRTYADFKNKHLFCKKATGIGATEFMLRFMAWLCLRNDDYKGSQMVIVVGPNWDLAVKMIKRMKALFEHHGIYFDSKESILELNGCSIQAYPSNNLGSFRSLTNPKFILIEEADFFRPSEQDEIRTTAERYIAKSDPWIVMVSTPNAPNGLFDKIEKEPFETCIYKKVYLDYTYAEGLLYTKEDIAKARRSPSFPREYELKYQGLVGNVLSSTAINRCISTGTKLAETAPLDDWSIATRYILSLDPGWGSSFFGILLSRFVNGKVQILYAKQFPRANFQNILDEIWTIKRKCNTLSNILLDASATEVYTALCNEFDQNPSQQYLRDRQTWCKRTNSDLSGQLFICPISFNIQGRELLSHTRRMVEETEDDGTSVIGVHSQFEDLIVSMRSAYAEDERLDKERTVNNDLFDSLRIGLSYYKWSKQ